MNASGAHVTSEIEEKFDLPHRRWVVPELAGVGRIRRSGPVRRPHLDATYFDTAGRALAGAGITVRRRTGGDDEGWHVKLRAVKGARTEVQFPLGRAVRRPPAAIQRLLTAPTAGASMRPIATITTDRRTLPLLADDGRVLADLVDDRVTASAAGAPAVLRWRELEVELVEGDGDDLAAIGAALIAAGARPSDVAAKLERVLPPPPHPPTARLDRGATVGELITAFLAAQLDAIVASDPLARVDAPDAIHKVRVASRRTRSALAAFRRHLDRAATDPIRDELRWLGQELGAARDSEVIRDRLLAALDDAGQDPGLDAADVAAARAMVERTMATRFGSDHVRAVVALDSARYARLLQTLRDAAAGKVLSGRHLDKRAGKALWRDVRRAQRRVERELDDLDAIGVGDADHRPAATSELDITEKLHEVRKAAKRVRYSAEAVAGVYGHRAEELAADREALQEALGDRQDAAVAGDVLIALASSASPDTAFVLGHLHGREQARGDAATAAATPLLDALRKGKRE